MYYYNHQTNSAARGRRLLIGALALGCALVTVPPALAQDIVVPATPAIITPPPGNKVFLLGQATGTQGYVCLPTSPGADTASWTVKGARPEATLFQTV